MLEAQYQINGETFFVDFLREDQYWGNGVRATLRRVDGKVLGHLKLACHPEFPHFAQCQSMTNEELVAQALKRIVNEGHQAVADCRGEITVQLPLFER